jgi:hypothetical protein
MNGHEGVVESGCIPMYASTFSWTFLTCLTPAVGVGGRRWVVSWKPFPPYLRGKSPRHPLDRMLGGTQSRFGQRGENSNPSFIQPVASRYAETRHPDSQSWTVICGNKLFAICSKYCLPFNKALNVLKCNEFIMARLCRLNEESLSFQVKCRMRWVTSKFRCWRTA